MSLQDLMKEAQKLPELTTAPAGKYTLRIAKVEEKESEKTGRKFLSVFFNFTDEDAQKYLPFNHNLMYPTEDDSNSTRDMFLRNLSSFFKAFNINDFSDLSEMPGNEGWASVKEVDSAEYGMQNDVRNFITSQ